jgi:PhnB protein
MAKPIPDGYRTVTPSFTFKDTQKALDFYQKAFGAKVLGVFKGLDGKGIMHAVFQIGDSMLMCGDEMSDKCKSAQTLGGTPISMFIYVPDADKTFDQAVAAGCKPDMPMADMFWGDRAGNVTDPFGYCWMIATHTQDLSEEQVKQNAEKFFAGMAKK